MNSVLKEINPRNLANTVHLLRATHRGAFLLVEGSTDSVLFKKFIDAEKCDTVNCTRKEFVIKALEILGEENLKGAIGFVDRDYDDYFPPIASIENLVLTDEADVEIMIMCSDALKNFIREFGSEGKLAAIEAAGISIRQLLFSSAARVGVLRLLSKQLGWNLSFEDMTYKFSDNTSFEIDLRQTVNHVLTRSTINPKPANNEVINAAQNLLSSTENLQAVCNGHDAVNVLRKAIRNKIGTDQTFSQGDGPAKIEKVLRLSYDFRFFSKTKAFLKMRAWEQNSGYAVFAPA